MFSILLGSVLAPTLVFLFSSLFSGKKFLTKRLVFSFILCMIGFSILSNVLWLQTINSHSYSESDPLLVAGHLMIAYDQPRFDELHGRYFESFFQMNNPLQHRNSIYQTSWLANGWSQFDLYLLWLGITLSVYLFTFLLLYFFNIHQISLRNQFLRFLMIDFIILILFSAVCGLFNPWTVSLLLHGLGVIFIPLVLPILHLFCSPESCLRAEILLF